MARRPAAALGDNQLATGSFHLRARQHDLSIGPHSIGPAIGTGVLLDRFGSTGRLGLVITNSHNLPGHATPCALRFTDARGEAQRAPVLTTLLDNPGKEYALLVVKLPRGMKAHPVARLSRDPSAPPSGEVYSVACVADRRAPDAPRTIVQFGHTRDRGALRPVDPRDGRPSVPSRRYSYRSRGGCSGAGVFGARSGELEALHWGNTTIFGRSIRSHAVPADLILRDIGRNLGGIPNRKARATVARLLSRSGVDVRPPATSNNTHTINDLTTIRCTGGTP